MLCNLPNRTKVCFPHQEVHSTKNMLKLTDLKWANERGNT